MQRFRDVIFVDGRSEYIIILYSKNVRLGFYFADFIFVVCQSTAKTAKIRSLKNFRLYIRYNNQNLLLYLPARSGSPQTIHHAQCCF